MIRKCVLTIALSCMLFFSLQGCRQAEEITRRSQLTNPIETGPITVLLRDGTLFELGNYRVTDSLLIGTGSRQMDGERQQFSGKLKLSNIDYVEAYETSFWKTFVATGAMIFFGARAISALQDLGSDDLLVQRTTRTYYPPSEGSCPFIYTFDGSQFHFESETFAGAVFKGAERSNYDVLYHLKPVDAKYILKLTNERAETDYLNEIQLLVADGPSDVKVLPSNAGAIHTISQPISPSSCVDFKARDVLNAVIERDGTYWETDLSSKDVARDEDLRDGLVLEFKKPAGAKIAKIVVNGVNTNLGFFAFEQLFKLKGDNKLRWYQQLENDPSERMKMIRFLMREGMLHINVWQHNEWVEHAALLDVGPLVAKDQVAVLDLSKVDGEVVKIKLQTTTDLWRIDQVYMDFSQDISVEVKELRPITAINDSGNDVSNLLRSDDDMYYVTITGDFAHITFNEVPLMTGMKRTYILRSKGYYHQWIDTKGEDHPALVHKILNEPLFGIKTFMPVWKDVKDQYE